MRVIEELPFKGNKYEAILGLKGAEGRIAVLRAANLEIELFEFHTPKPRSANPLRPVSDHGITHFAMNVEGIEELYARLKAAGVVFHCAPIEFAGCATATYARDPDGNVIELLEAIAPA
jgi:catechol 2,3-dioxygenase-like lactoylglutathione lyase family enzyme